MTDDLLSRVRELGLGVPDTEERRLNGQPTFFVAGKQFAQFREGDHDDHRTVVCVRASSLDEREMRVETDPETYSRHSHSSAAEWVAVNLAADRVDWEMVAGPFAASWELAAPRYLLQGGGR